MCTPITSGDAPETELEQLKKKLEDKERAIQQLGERLEHCQLQILGYESNTNDLHSRLRGMEQVVLELSRSRPTNAEIVDSSVGDLPVEIETPSKQQTQLESAPLESIANSKDSIPIETNSKDLDIPPAPLEPNSRDSDVPPAPLKPTRDSDVASSDLRPSVLKWESCQNAPCHLYKGTCTSYLFKAYFSPSGSDKVYEYDHQLSKWSSLPTCPQSYFALVTINGLVTAVGGWKEGVRKRPSNSLQSFLVPATDSSSSGSWVERYPPMPTARAYPSAATHRHILIVAGGESISWKDNFITNVEVLDTETLQWSIASSLPVPIRGASGTVCSCWTDNGAGIGDDSDTTETSDATEVYFLGGWDETGTLVLKCPLSKLLSTRITWDPKREFLLPTEVPCSCAWQQKPQSLSSVVKNLTTPHLESTCFSVGDCLYVVGGRKKRGLCTGEVFKCEPLTGSWVQVGDSMPTARSHVLATCLSDGKTVVVAGGLTKESIATKSVEVGFF